MSKVYFAAVKESDDLPSVVKKLSGLLDASKALDFIRRNDSVAVKMHFGEEGNTGYVRPQFAGVVCERIAAKKASAFLADTNTLYRGRRTNSTDHLKLAAEHGFTKEACKASLIIPDDSDKANVADVK